MHVDYAPKQMPNLKSFTRAYKYARIGMGEDPTCVCYHPKTGMYTFSYSRDFDKSDEPTVGKIINIDPETLRYNDKYVSKIWHHKWCWVADDYKGFDVDASFKRSEMYTKYISSPVSEKHAWQSQLMDMYDQMVAKGERVIS